MCVLQVVKIISLMTADILGKTPFKITIKETNSMLC